MLRNPAKWTCPGLTSQVSQRPQQASVVIRRPLQPGFLARKVNSLTAQPTKVRTFPLEVLRTQQQPARRRRAMGPRNRYASFMLLPGEGEERESVSWSSRPPWGSQKGWYQRDPALSISEEISQEIADAHKLHHRCPKCPLTDSNTDYMGPCAHWTPNLQGHPQAFPYCGPTAGLDLGVLKKKSCSNGLFKMNTKYESHPKLCIIHGYTHTLFFFRSTVFVTCSLKIIFSVLWMDVESRWGGRWIIIVHPSVFLLAQPAAKPGHAQMLWNLAPGLVALYYSVSPSLPDAAALCLCYNGTSLWFHLNPEDGKLRGAKT